ncbi:cyclophane-forming radical SAM peptide maturase AmcB [Plantactinospora sp. KBS50]|uniref:cyclophane-forming radical SAM peptide maturase AmcB n=1 Tax=Plantactinospora sp. KBS50 TaxID=2024580 RepID=UPI000BAB0CD8|nr:cyclophane-forming radical SAM peptide maturase AmcB [Plantactinospora sp. KBS50]ASW53074.1 radical SAM/SPASM domain-containing protein [Plantactinospora sp. KBS50]
MRGVADVPAYVVMQPITLCNLDCAYCYLPLRAADRRMPVSVAAAVAESVNQWATGDRFSVVWHGGEPLAAGRRHLAELFAPFAGQVEHHVQTNATLIDDAWCEFFERHQVRVSVSVDGPRHRNADRVTRSGRPAYDRIERGMATLRRHGVPFSALCVVSRPEPGLATELYDYFLDLGCSVLGINIEETEGVNTRSNALPAGLVREFWAELVTAWRRDPRIHLREVEWSLRYAGAVLDGAADELLPRRLDPIPTIAHDGSVVLLSPELAGFSDPRYGDFSSGNVLSTPLPDILAGGPDTPWVAEFLRGVEACRSSCAYFEFCGGGHAANRYFEHGRFDGTETEHCRNSKIHLLEGVLDHARDNAATSA